MPTGLESAAAATSYATHGLSHTMPCSSERDHKRHPVRSSGSLVGARSCHRDPPSRAHVLHHTDAPAAPARGDGILDAPLLRAPCPRCSFCRVARAPHHAHGGLYRPHAFAHSHLTRACRVSHSLWQRQHRSFFLRRHSARRFLCLSTVVSRWENVYLSRYLICLMFCCVLVGTRSAEKLAPCLYLWKLNKARLYFLSASCRRSFSGVSRLFSRYCLLL